MCEAIPTCPRPVAATPEGDAALLADALAVLTVTARRAGVTPPVPGESLSRSDSARVMAELIAIAGGDAHDGARP